MKFAFVDDSSETLSQLNTLVHKFGNTHGYSLDSESFSSGEDFLASFTPFSYDIIFMDIYMTGMNGIHTAKSLRQLDSKAMIIFLTSSMEHMGDAFSCHAFDYLCKPIDEARLTKVLEDAIRVLPGSEPYLPVVCGGVELRLRFSELVCLSTTGHYTKIITEDDSQYTPYISYKEISQKLSGDSRFLQINKCVLVNMNFILRFEDKKCYMTNDIVLPVNTRNAKMIEQTWRNYIFAQLHHALDERRPQ